MSQFSLSNSVTNPTFDDGEENGNERRKSIEAHVAPTVGLGGAQVAAPIDFDDVVDANDLKRELYDDEETPKGIDMWSIENIGLYAHYTAVGLLYGLAAGTARTACAYVYSGPANFCNTLPSLVFLSWNLKIFFAVFTDCVWPFGLRRKPYLIFGWTGVMIILLVISFFAPTLNAESFGLLMVLNQTFFMVGNVPADGYCVELAEFEEKHLRGQILATGQALRFSMGILSNVFQAFLLNGPTTNPSNITIGLFEGWTWGLDLQSFFALYSFMILLLMYPIFRLKEIDSSDVERRNPVTLMKGMWGILQNKTSLYLIVFGAIMRSIAGLVPATYSYMQYYVIGISNFQSGVESMMEYLLLTLAVLTFKNYLINRNWRYVNYFSEVISTIYSFVWFIPFYDVAGLRTGWFTVFINISSAYIESLTQVLLSVAVIEIAEKGMEATTYELIISITNSCITLSSIIATQLTSAFGVNTVEINEGPEAFEAENGPERFAIYTAVVQLCGIAGLIVATQFLPVNREMCHKWREEGEASGRQTQYGVTAVTIAVLCIGYGLITSIFYFDPELSCQEWVGGSGCD